MTGREKIEAALSAEGTREIPVAICYESIPFRDNFAQYTDQPWWALLSGDMQMHLAVHRDRIRNLPQDWYHLPSGPSYYEREHIRIEERADNVYRIDVATGREQKLEPPRVGGRFIDIGKNRPSPQSRDEVDVHISMPTQDELFKIFDEGRHEVAGKLLESDSKEVFPMCNSNAPLWGCINSWTFEELMEKAVTDIELVEYACERRAERAALHAAVAAKMGAKGVWIEECMTDMVSPAFYRRLNLPGLQKIIKAYRAAGIYTILYYCGNPLDRLELLLESGADALAFEENKKGFSIDIDKLSEQINGRATLLGNLDAINILEKGSEELLRLEIERQISAGRKNKDRFIMSLGSPVTPGTTPERVKLYCELGRELGYK